MTFSVLCICKGPNKQIFTIPDKPAEKKGTKDLIHIGVGFGIGNVINRLQKTIPEQREFI